MIRLWKPNKRIMSPVCERCGGLSRTWLSRNRRRAGLSFHRACCCDPCGGICADEIEVTFAGVNASVCSGCKTITYLGNTFYLTVEAFALDGVFQLPRIGSTNSGCAVGCNAPCEYSLQVTEGFDIVVRVWDTAGCTNLNSEHVATHMNLSVNLGGDNKISRIEAIVAAYDPTPGGAVNAVFPRLAFLAYPYATKSIGDAVGNFTTSTGFSDCAGITLSENSCDWSQIYTLASGGTATVVKV